MRAVLDPNVLVSALLSPHGSPSRLLHEWFEGGFELVVSPLLLSELERVLAYPKIEARVPAEEAVSFLMLLTQAALLIADSDVHAEVVSRDPNDQYLITLASTARAVIVSGDKHLLDLEEHLPVFSPSSFIDFLRSR